MTVEEDIYNCTEITYDGQVIREDDDGLTPEEKKEQQYKKNSFSMFLGPKAFQLRSKIQKKNTPTAIKNRAQIH